MNKDDRCCSGLLQIKGGQDRCHYESPGFWEKRKKHLKTQRLSRNVCWHPELIPDGKNQKSSIDAIKEIPLSDMSNMRRVESLALDVFETLLDRVLRM